MQLEGEHDLLSARSTVFRATLHFIVFFPRSSSSRSRLQELLHCASDGRAKVGSQH